MIINTVYFLFLHQYMKLKSINITQKIEGGSDCDNVILLSGGGGGVGLDYGGKRGKNSKKLIT